MPKEIHFFDNEMLDWAFPPYDQLEAKMSFNAAASARGDATPIYMYWPNSIERLQRYDASAKIIVLLRHPVYRAHSHWRMETKRGLEDLAFSEAIRVGRDRVAASQNGAHRVFSYVERGFYAQQIRRLRRFFPRSQVHFETTDMLWLNPKQVLSAIERFLEIDELLDPLQEYVIAASTQIEHSVCKDDEELLMNLYRSDIVETEALTGSH